VSGGKSNWIGRTERNRATRSQTPPPIGGGDCIALAGITDAETPVIGPLTPARVILSGHHAPCTNGEIFRATKSADPNKKV